MKIKSLFYQFVIGLLAFAPILASCDSDDVTLAKVDDAQQSVDLQSITQAVAVDVAARFTDRKNGDVAKAASRSTLPIETIKDNNDNVIAYAVNYEDGGWVVVSATKAYYPILAYSDEGQFAFDKSDQTTGLEIWIDEIGLAIESADSFDDETTSQIALEWLEYQPESLSTSSGSGLPGGNSPEAVACRARLKELNETYYQDGWSFTTLPQVSEVTMPSDVYSLADSHSSPYEYTIVGLRDIGIHNYVAPLLTTQWYQQAPYNMLCPNGSPAGCVPTAMAQIMKFHRYPSQFNWDDMPDAIATYSIQSLLKDIGTTIGAKYLGNITGASYIDALNGFVSYGYSAELKDFADDDVISFITSERAPVYMRGTGNSGIGHAWVCDGVSQHHSRYGYYVEFLVGGSYTNLNEYWIDYPRELDVLNLGRVNYHMNWGEKDVANGWYYEAKVNGSDFSYDRKNIYVKPKTN